MLFFYLFINVIFSAGFFPPGPRLAPPMPDCEMLDSPLICSLAKTQGRCTWITRDNKCDIAEKCGGRSQQDCALYWTGHYQGPNCVWLALEGKCDASDKCYGRDKATCLNTAFPRCTWVAPYTNSWGQIYPGGMCTEFKGLSLAYQTGQQAPLDGTGAGMVPTTNLGPAVIPVQIECEILQSPVMCNLESTMGNCAWLEEDQKCDLAEKCGGRSKATCALYYSLKYSGPNCVWLEMESKCDSSKKCYGRDKSTCMNTRFPLCTWTQPYLTTWGQEFPEGMCTEYKGVPMLPGKMELQTVHENAATKQTQTTSSPLMGAVLIGFGSFITTALCTTYVLSKRQQNELTSHL